MTIAMRAMIIIMGNRDRYRTVLLDCENQDQNIENSWVYFGLNIYWLMYDKNKNYDWRKDCESEEKMV